MRERERAMASIYQENTHKHTTKDGTLIPHQAHTHTLTTETGKALWVRRTVGKVLLV